MQEMKPMKEALVTIEPLKKTGTTSQSCYMGILADIPDMYRLNLRVYSGDTFMRQVSSRLLQNKNESCPTTAASIVFYT